MDNRELVHEMITFAVLHRYLIGRAAAPTGLYWGQPFMLEYITEHPGCTQKVLADELHISPASAATSLGRLENAGFLLRTTDKADERKKKLTITQNGREALERFYHICAEADEKIFQDFSDEDKDILGAYLKKLEENILNCGITDDELAELMRKRHNPKKHTDNKCFGGGKYDQ